MQVLYFVTASSLGEILRLLSKDFITFPPFLPLRASLMWIIIIFVIVTCSCLMVKNLCNYLFYNQSRVVFRNLKNNSLYDLVHSSNDISVKHILCTWLIKTFREPFFHATGANECQFKKELE